MFMFDWSALMNPPEGHPEHHAYTFVIGILSTSITSVSIFSVCSISVGAPHACLGLTRHVLAVPDPACLSLPPA
jgi:hypothetical protein